MQRWRILIVDDEDDIRSVMRAVLSPSYEVVEARNGSEALDKLEVVEPDFVILDVMMPVMDGFKTCEAIRSQPRYQALPVLFLSALNSRDDMVKGYASGANLYLGKPFEPSRLVRNVDVFFETNPVVYTQKRYTLDQLREMEKNGWASADRNQHSTQSSAAPEQHAVTNGKPRVLIVDDEESMRTVMKTMLDQQFEVFTASDGLQGIERITTYEPDLIILDAMMPKMSGYQLCKRLRRVPRFAKTPILFVSAKATPRDRDYAMEAGANGFLGKPFDARELEQRVLQLTSHADFKPQPKTLTAHQIEEKETARDEKLTDQQERKSRHEAASELEQFLKEHKE